MKGNFHVRFLGEGAGGNTSLLPDGGTLYDCKCSWKRQPFTIMHLKQVVAYALLDWDDELKLRGLGWYFARQRMIIEHPIHKLISDLADKRAALKELLQTQQQKKPPLSIAAFLDNTLPKHHSLAFFDEDEPVERIGNPFFRDR